MLNLLLILGALNNSFKNVRGSGESASPDVKAAEELLETLDKVMAGQNYLSVLTLPPYV